MYPVLFHWRTFTLYTYGPLIAVAVLAGLWLARRRAAQFGLDPEKVWTVGIYAVLAALAVAKVWFVLAEWEYYSKHLREILSFSTLLSRRMLLRQASARPLGRHVYQSCRGRPGRNPAWHSSASDAALRVRVRVRNFHFPSVAREAATVHRRNLWRVRDPLRRHKRHH